MNTADNQGAVAEPSRFLSRQARRKGRLAVTAGLVNLLAACGGGGGADGGTVQANQVPVAAFSSAASGSGYAFDASQSFDTDGSIDNYEWDFGDGSTATGKKVSHTFPEAGSYQVTLMVIDSDGSSDSLSISVKVASADLWQPAPGTSWQIQLNGPVDTSFEVSMYLLDLFDTTRADIARLHDQGRVVVCHFSAGVWENWRSDATAFPDDVIGNNTGAPGEKWLDIRNIDALSLITQGRLDAAAQKGCDGVAADNVDGYTNNTGFPLSGSDQLAYNRWLADQAHARGLSIGLKNDLEQVADLEPDFDWAFNEQCFEYGKCDLLLPFVQAGKAVFGIEYDLSVDAFCPQAGQLGFDFLKKRTDLQAWRIACDTQAGNAPPVASFSATASSQGGDTMEYDASNSSDDGMIASYQWEFGDGSSSQGSRLISHTYLADGTYDVVLTVTDDGGLSDAFILPVSINTSSNAPPEARFTVNTSSGTAPLAVTFDASASSDDGEMAGYEWNFGDAGATASGRTAMHTYNQAGAYTATLTVTDDGGLSASTTKQVLVSAAPLPAAIWQPAPGTSWQWQLTGTIDTSVDVQMYDIDLFDTPKSTIDTLHGQGRVVICYFSAGSWENWRPDAAAFPAPVKGNSNGWPGEKWLDISNINVLSPIMQARLDLAVEKGCDGVEPDNIDGYTNNTGFPLSGSHQLAYNRWLADQAHARGLSIGLKNDLEQVAALEPDFDWALNEQCFEYDECDLLLPFVQAGKAVFGVEYSGSTASFCSAANSMDFDWLKKNMDLDAWRQACR